MDSSQRAYDVATVRAAEALAHERAGPGVLMQRAAAGLAATTAQALGRVYGARVVLLVGSGDNGGDALYAGARLACRGARVDALLADETKVHAAGLAALRAAGGRVTDDLGVTGRADVVLDGLVGIGGTGGLRPAAARLADAAAAAGLIIAVDLPSGVDADTGEVAGAAVHADLTVTFGVHKPGLLVDPGASLAGSVVLVDIGLTDDDLGAADRPAVVEWWLSRDVATALPRASSASDKYARGVVGVLAGSATYSGAAVLSVGAAIRAGAGMVRAVHDPAVATAVRYGWPGAVVTELAADTAPTDAGRVQAWVVGPGMGTDEAAARRLDDVLATDVPVLVDADGLAILARRGGPVERTAPTLLTPHAGELARLLGVDRSDVEARRLAAVRRAADELGATVLLKGSTTLVAAPGTAPMRVNRTGTPALATAGTGDVLSGLIGALMAGGLGVLDAATAGAYLHGLAGRLAADGARPIAAGDVLAAIPRAFATVDPTAVRPDRKCT